MIRAVYDTNLLVSAFLSRNDTGGVSNELLRFAQRGAVQLHLSPDIVAETLATLLRSRRAQRRYAYTPSEALAFCEALSAAAAIVVNPPPTPGAVPRDPDDDKIIAAAVAAEADYLVSRDHDLLSLGSYQGVKIIAPEEFLRVVRDTP
jgi:uncharacterized protein